MKIIKKILVVGKFSVDPDIYTYADSFYKTFKELGYCVKTFDNKKKFLFFSNNFFINIALLIKVLKFKPDLIFLVKSENIFFKTIRILKNKLKILKFKNLIVNFYPDNPFVFWNGNSNSNILRSFPLYDCFLIWSRILIPVLRSAGCKNVYYFPFAYDQDLFSKDIKITEEERKKYSSDVCFVGTWDNEREELLTELCSCLPNLNLKIWGNMWNEKLPQNSILRKKIQNKAIYKERMIKVFRLSKIVLNFIRKQNITSHNMKTFEIPASGAFMLAERTNEQANYLFKEGESIACFNGINELVKKIRFYLQLNDLRKKIMENGIKQAEQFPMKIILKNFMCDFEKELIK